MTNITITDEILNQILVEVAFPIIDFSDFAYTKDQVKELFIAKAMREYYIQFPIKSYGEISATGVFEIAFPNDDVFNVIDARLNTNDISGSNTIINDPLVRSRNVTRTGYGQTGMYGTPYSYGNERTYHSRRAEYQAVKNTQGAFRFKVDHNTRKVTGYTNVQGKVNVTWAEHSTDFGHIPFEKIDDVISLSKAHLMRGWGNMLLISQTDLGNEIDGQFLVDRSDDLKEEVYDRWQSLTKVIIIRSR